jgi:hypothetical protein
LSIYASSLLERALQDIGQLIESEWFRQRGLKTVGQKLGQGGFI